MSAEAPSLRAQLTQREIERNREINDNPFKSGTILTGGMALNVASMLLALSETAEVHLKQFVTTSGNLATEVSLGYLSPAIVVGLFGLLATTAGIALDRSNFKKSSEGLRGDVEELVGPLDMHAFDGPQTPTSS